MDPYIIIKYKGKDYKTDVCIGGDQNPVWNNEIEIPIQSTDDALKIICEDKDPLIDDIIGESIVPISTFLSRDSS